MKRARPGPGLLCLLLLAAGSAGEDWPTYRHDYARSGASGERLAAPLALAWAFRPTHGPAPAWPKPHARPIEEVLELPRLRFDDAFHVAAAAGSVFFGSSADDKVYALDARTGRVRWEVFTGGPVRVAPTVADGRVYVGSDDGKVYCLAADTGRAVWTFSAAPGPDKALGNGRIISAWPVRTGVVVDGGVAYFGAGVFPAEGVAMFALDARTGKRRWVRSGFAVGRTGISPQGCMVLSPEKLFVPSGRAMPAAFRRSDGRLLFHQNYSWRRIGLAGGTDLTRVDDVIFAGVEQLVAVREEDGVLAFVEGLPAAVPSEGARRIAASDDALYVLTGKHATAYDRAKWLAARPEMTRTFQRLVNMKAERDRLQDQVEDKPHLARRLKLFEERIPAAEKAVREATSAVRAWQVPCTGNDAVAAAPSAVFVGGEGEVLALDPADGRTLWRAKVSGRARGLAVADGRLLVSTDDGAIHCFVPGKEAPGRKLAPKVAADPFAGPLPGDLRAVADQIVTGRTIRGGYALLLGDGAARLALELARRTQLASYVVAPDAKRAAAAREALSAGGVYGARAVVLSGPLADLSLPDYFANVVVVRAGAGDDAAPAPPEELVRLLKPCGGVLLLRPPPAKDRPDVARFNAWQLRLHQALDRASGEPSRTLRVQAGWESLARGRLKGAGDWTHQYADPANTACGGDTLARAPLRVLWYGEPGPALMSSRHAQAAAPLVVGGRMFVQGDRGVLACDAYNGLKLWERDMPDPGRLGVGWGGCSNLAADERSIFLARKDRCLRLDAATGETLRTYELPKGRGKGPWRWGYVARSGGLLYGTAGPPTRDRKNRETVRGVAPAKRLFAVDAETGAVRWVHEGGEIMTLTICVGDGRIFFVDRTVTRAQREQAMKGVTHEPRVDRLGKPVGPDVRLIVALDAATGEKLWQRPHYVSDCVRVGPGGGELAAMYARGVLVLCAQPWNGHFWRDFFSGKFSRRSLIAIDAATSEVLWSGHKGYRSRPVIVGDRIVAEPWACDLRTGADHVRNHPVTGESAKWQMSRPGHHCGTIAAGPNILLFRSACTGYYDLVGDYGTDHFPAQRPGCWINCLPAAGLVVMPEASSGCVCPYALVCTVVFRPARTTRGVWGTFSAPGPLTPVQRLAVNLGAPGDRKDGSGRLWLAWPRPGTSRLVLQLPLAEQMLDDGRHFYEDPRFRPVAGTGEPWIYTSGAEGLRELLLPFGTDEGPPPPERRYTVRLHFVEPAGLAPGGRVFDVALQGRTVLRNLDVAKAAGGGDKALVKEFRSVRAAENLRLELRAIKGAPVLCGLEVVHEP